eukprot:6762770-Prymnesium_polylepis.1
MEPPPFTPPRGIFRHDRMLCQNWFLMSLIGWIAKDKRSAYSARACIICVSVGTSGEHVVAGSVGAAGPYPGR